MESKHPCALASHARPRLVRLNQQVTQQSDPPFGIARNHTNRVSHENQDQPASRHPSGTARHETEIVPDQAGASFSADAEFQRVPVRPSDLVEAALADALTVHGVPLNPICQEELYNPGREVSINPNQNSILTP